MVDEILEVRIFGILLSHENQRQKRREQHGPRRELLRLERNNMAQAFALHPVAHLIMILAENDEAFAMDQARGVPMPALAMRRVLTRIDVPFLVRFSEL